MSINEPDTPSCHSSGPPGANDVHTCIDVFYTYDMRWTEYASYFASIFSLHNLDLQIPKANGNGALSNNMFLYCQLEVFQYLVCGLAPPLNLWQYYFNHKLFIKALHWCCCTFLSQEELCYGVTDKLKNWLVQYSRQHPGMKMLGEQQIRIQGVESIWSCVMLRLIMCKTLTSVKSSHFSSSESFPFFPFLFVFSSLHGGAVPHASIHIHSPFLRLFILISLGCICHGWDSTITGAYRVCWLHGVLSPLISKK